MDVRYRRDPLKVLRKMQRAKAEDILSRMARIAASPGASDNNVLPLKGVPNGFRLRVGDWRVSYTIDRVAGVIDVFEVAPRGGAYR
jgi:mRNA interferase RelE/StbE